MALDLQQHTRRRTKGTANRPWWSQRETEYLHSLVGDFPTPLIVRQYTRWAVKQGLPARSPYAIEQKLCKLGVSRIPVGRYITAGTLVKLLDISYTTVDRWVERGHLPAYVFASGDPRVHGVRPPRRVFKRSDVVQLAIDSPRLFAGTPRDQLFLLLENADLADNLAAQYPRRFGRDATPVECVETGQEYPSITAAAKAVYVTKNCLGEAMKRGSRAGGYHWRMVVS